MYQEILNLNARPFSLTPYANHFVPHGPVNVAFEQVNGAIGRDAGPTVIVGPHGTGKSLLLALLADQYADQFAVVSLACGPMTERGELLQAILFELKQPYRDMTEGELRLSLIDFIKPTEKCPNGVLLLVDDAQALTPDLVDELRLITNFVRDGIPRVRLVMVGTDRLEETLTEPKLEAFNQRVSARCYLGSLTRDETTAYIHGHITRAGGNAEAIFATATCATIHDLTQGCPRFVNQLCEQSLIAAAEGGMLVVEPNLAEIAWAAVQGLPAPEHLLAVPEAFEDLEEWTVIEFGSLDDDDDLSEVETNNAIAESADFTESAESTEPTADEVEVTPTLDASPLAIGADASGQTSNEWDDLGGDVMDFGAGQASSIPTEVQDLAPMADEPSSDDASSETLDTQTLDALNQDQDATWAAAGVGDDPSDVTYRIETNETGVEAITIESSADALPSIDLPTAADAPVVAAEEPEFSPPEVINPFAESFESEEQISDGFGNAIASQNLASSQVTAFELEHLHPLDDTVSSDTSDVPLVSYGPSDVSAALDSATDVAVDGDDADDVGVADALLSAPSLVEVADSIGLDPSSDMLDEADGRPMSSKSVEDVFSSMVTDADFDTDSTSVDDNDAPTVPSQLEHTEEVDRAAVFDMEQPQHHTDLGTIDPPCDVTASDAFETPAAEPIGVADSWAQQAEDVREPADDVTSEIESPATGAGAAVAPDAIEIYEPLQQVEQIESVEQVEQVELVEPAESPASFNYPAFGEPAAAVADAGENYDRLSNIIASLSGDAEPPSEPVPTIESFAYVPDAEPVVPAHDADLVFSQVDPAQIAAARVDPVNEADSTLDHASSEIADASESTSSVDTSGFHEHRDDSVSSEIQRKADEIMRSLAAASEDDANQVSHETPPSTPGAESYPVFTPVTTVAAADSGSDSHSTEDGELSKSQHILNEILAQKQLLEGHVAPSDVDEPESYAFVPTLGEPGTMRDVTNDRVNAVPLVPGALPSDSVSPASGLETPPSQVSVGKATRMDYEALFRQLRDVQDE